jgi:hypothetical protein
MDLTTHASVNEYFHEVIVEALGRTCVQATEGAECYLVNLLGEFTRARLPDEPLSLKLARAQGDPAERVKALKEVGDTTLYVTGFFAASLERRLVDASYYRNLGEAAYRELAQRLHGAGSIGEIYWELAAKFPRFVDVLAEVRKQVDCASADVVKLYEQWLASRSEWIEHRLRALGVLMSDDSAKKGYLQ